MKTELCYGCNVNNPKNPIQQGVCRTMALPLAFKNHLKAKRRRIMETQILHHAQI
jgi:hypothetical protein